MKGLSEVVFSLPDDILTISPVLFSRMDPPRIRPIPETAETLMKSLLGILLFLLILPGF
jgi:hypothetical protein